ncbi:metallophosphoesterase [Candidatus Pacearchaeota archaeon]|nr:metallophosphoesterase [Candidatus Pacearchaeota archaeon]
MEQKFVFIDKTVFFPEYGILVIGDLHVGYEHSLRDSGVMIPESQTDDTIKNLQEIINEIKRQNWNIKKIVFLGDIKHYFGYEWKERVYFNKILDFLRKYVKDSGIVLIKGNHDKFDFSGKKMKNYFIKDGIAFFHGHMSYNQVSDEKIKIWVIGHLHPSIMLSDKQNIKREKYKCFLVGEFNSREVIIVPSFLGIIEGTSVNEEGYENEKEFSIIPHDAIKSFNAYVVDEKGKVLDFGKVRKL